LATTPTERRASPSPAISSQSGRGDGAELKRVPPSRELRGRIRASARATAEALDHSRPLAKQEIEASARRVLAQLGLPEHYLGWTMVVLASAFWRRGVMATPRERRLLLLPQCLRRAETCRAKTNELGLLCENCGACSLAALRDEAESLGYRVLIAEGTPIVMRMILEGYADAILGVGCLNVLEKTLDKILLAGLPCMAVPLLTGQCRDTSTDEDWVREMIATPYRPGVQHTQTYVHLLREAASLFEPERFERLVPWGHSQSAWAEGNGRGLADLEPLVATAQIARRFVLRGGKHYRPFITLAAYDAMTGAAGLGPSGAEAVRAIPLAVKRIALAIEIFHKASLVHDDVEDDDPFRYGRPTVHRQFGIPTAVNVGDYLIGLGYRLVASQQEKLDAAAVTDILAQLSRAHTCLCEGQGAELVWREGRWDRLTPLDTLTVYALKTAPAFEAALYAGLRLAGPADAYRPTAARFARHLGVAYQILNDLSDGVEDPDNKRSASTDVARRRPTILWALALDGLPPADRSQLVRLASAGGPLAAENIQAVRQLYQKAEAYHKARQLVEKHRKRACRIAESVGHSRLRQLLHYFVDAILDRPGP